MKTKKIAKSMLFIAAINIFPSGIFTEGTTGTFEIKAKNDLASMNLFGKVKSIDEISYKSQGGDLAISDKYKEHTRQVLFNSAGNITGEFIYNANGSLNNKSSCTFNSKGLRTRYILYDAGGMVYDSVMYDYDDMGNIVEEISLGDDARYYYDNNGNRLEETHYDRSTLDGMIGIPYMKITYKYDQKGNQIEKSCTEYDPDYGDANSKWTYRYNENGNVIEENSNNMFDPPRRTYKYDSLGNLTETSSYKQDGSLDVNKSYTYTYVKDGQQNWTLKNTYQNKTHIQSVVRVIKYY